MRTCDCSVCDDQRGVDVSVRLRSGKRFNPEEMYDVDFLDTVHDEVSIRPDPSHSDRHLISLAAKWVHERDAVDLRPMLRFNAKEIPRKILRQLSPVMTSDMKTELGVAEEDADI